MTEKNVMMSANDRFFKRGPPLSMWQAMIRDYASEKGFDWTKAEIDTMLLRIISELCEAAEAARDIPIKKKIKLIVTVHTNDILGRTLGYDNLPVEVGENGKFYVSFESPLYLDDVLTVCIDGQITEEFEPDEHVAEELADVFIRLADMTKVLGIDLETEVWTKHKKNLTRPIKHGRGRK